MLSESTTLTRSAAGALTSRVTSDNDKLPGDVLLAIFDAYRQLHEHQPDYEKVWNSRDGWFKLAHVCMNWRHTVLSSSFHLQVHLLFTPRRSPTDPVLRCLPPFPILIHYSTGPWTEEEGGLALAAITIRHRNRVRGFTLQSRRSDWKQDAEFFRALNHPFPELESLEICPPYSFGPDPILPPAFLLRGSAPSLRRLTLREVKPDYISLLLSHYATGLVELSLTIKRSAPGALLFTNLQHMSCLRRLELDLDFEPSDSDPPPPDNTGDVIPLSKLTHLIFKGYKLYLLALVDGLVAPSLQHLEATLHDQSRSFSTIFHHDQSRNLFPIPHLCKLICDTDCQFTTVHLGLSHFRFRFYAGTGSKSVDDQPFKIITHEPDSLEQVGQELSGPLSTVEELIIAWDVYRWLTETYIQTDKWRGFCYHVPQVKVVQVPVEVALDIARCFKQEPSLDLLPVLERIEVHSMADFDELYVPICEAFEPFISARKREGRPISLSWIYWIAE
ncbi:hypothetical protein EDB84DRAFT_1472773 [Lactarius hengduanensis]|nr:hypothetical protein EDB84DRAFT_1472773 [Lactarius hengduanensis]